ncbi:MAG TPA: lipoprotein [Burkholderiales bacterium]
MRFLLAGIVLAFLAAGCGQRGPLYLRDNPPPGVKPEKPERAKPVPYPRDERDATEAK